MLLTLALALSPTITHSDSLTAAQRLRPTAQSVLATAPAFEAVRPLGIVPGRLEPMGLRTGVEPGPDREGEPQLIEYSDAYFTRLTIHRWASYLTVPLFVSQYVVGRKLMNGEGSDRLRSVHGALAGGVAALFAVNTITGGLNAVEAWKDPEGRNRRTLHTALMLLADAGFVATGVLAREREWGEGGGSNRAHRDVALASMGTSLLGYAIMLPIFGRN